MLKIEISLRQRGRKKKRVRVRRGSGDVGEMGRYMRKRQLRLRFLDSVCRMHAGWPMQGNGAQ